MWCYVAWYFAADHFMCSALSIKCLSSFDPADAWAESFGHCCWNCSFFHVHLPLRWTISTSNAMDGSREYYSVDWTIPLLLLLRTTGSGIFFSRRLTRGRSKRKGCSLLIIDRVNDCRIIIITRLAQVQKLIEYLILASFLSATGHSWCAISGGGAVRQRIDR